MQKSLGKVPSGKRLEKIKQSPNYWDGSFQNIEKTVMIAEGVSYFQLAKKYFGKAGNRSPKDLVPSVKTNLKDLPTDRPTIIWFGHSSYLISVNGINILVDPVFSTRPSPVQFAGTKAYPGSQVYSAEDMPILDVVIITHDHYDHLDYNSILSLQAKTKLFCTALGVGSHLEYWGVPPSTILEFDWWDSHTVIPNVELTSTPARHFSGRGFTRNTTLWSSFVLNIGGYKIFIGGDSGYTESFKTIGDKFGPFDLAILENGQYNAIWPNIHMMPGQNVQASLDLKAKVLMPVHWAKFTLALHPWNEPIKLAKKSAAELKVTLTTPKIGEKVIVGETYPASNWFDF